MNTKGFTLIELIIALAIIAAISGTIAVYFTSMTDKARLKSDIQSAQTIESAIELYSAEQGGTVTKTDMYEIIAELADSGYLRRKDYKEQLPSAKWIYTKNNKNQMQVFLDISSCGTKITTDLYNTLSDNEKLYVKK